MGEWLHAPACGCLQERIWYTSPLFPLTHPPNSTTQPQQTGARFRAVLGLSSAHSDEACGRALVDRYVCVHLEGHGEKQECLLHMLRKLYAFVQGQVRGFGFGFGEGRCM